MAYTIVLKFEVVEGKCPLSATKEVVKWIEKGVENMIFEVEDEDTGESYFVDLDDNSVRLNLNER